jgi:hypothetical protein
VLAFSGLDIAYHRLAAFADMHVLDTDDLPTAVAHAPKNLDLSRVGFQ